MKLKLLGLITIFVLSMNLVAQATKSASSGYGGYSKGGSGHVNKAADKHNYPKHAEKRDEIVDKLDKIEDVLEEIKKELKNK